MARCLGGANTASTDSGKRRPQSLPSPTLPWARPFSALPETPLCLIPAPKLPCTHIKWPPSLTGCLEALRRLRRRGTAECVHVEWVGNRGPCLAVLAVMRMSNGAWSICPCQTAMAWFCLPDCCCGLDIVCLLENLHSGLVPKAGPLRDDWVIKGD